MSSFSDNSSSDNSSHDTSSEEECQPPSKRSRTANPPSSSNPDPLPEAISAVVRVQKEHLICPVCQDFPRMEVYQCSNGHIVCNGCIAKIAHCALCRVTYPDQKIRNRVAETDLDDMTYNCSFKNRGCLQTNIARNRRNAHEIQCRFNPRQTGVKFCSLFNATGPCRFRICPNTILQDPEHAKDVINHLTSYPLGRPSTSTTTLPHVKVKIGAKKSVRFRVPILPNDPDVQPIKLFEVFDGSPDKTVGYFVLIRRVSMPGRQNLSWAVVGLNSAPENIDGGGNPQSGGKIRVKFLIKARTSREDKAKDGDECVSNLSWTVMSIYLDEWKEFMMMRSKRRPPFTFAIPEVFLVEYYKRADWRCEMTVTFGPVVE